MCQILILNPSIQDVRELHALSPPVRRVDTPLIKLAITLKCLHIVQHRYVSFQSQSQQEAKQFLTVPDLVGIPVKQ